MLPEGAGAAAAFALGLIFGSFANVCIHRLPEGESVVSPRSRCPGCGGLIAWYDNIPLLSWVLLRARCRRCGAPIAWTYPLVELAMGAGFLACWLLFGPTLEGAAAAWLTFSCVVLGVVDMRHFILPDAVTLTGIAAGIGFSAARGMARLPGGPEGSASDIFLGGVLDHPPLLLASAAGALGGAAIPLVARAGYMMVRRLRGGPDSGRGGHPGSVEPASAAGDGEADDDVREAALEEGMGLGDVKMLAMVGAFLGPKPILVTILAGSITGCLVTIPWLLLTRRGFRTPIPFGPYLAFGGLVALFAGEKLSAAYSDLILRMTG